MPGGHSGCCSTRGLARSPPGEHGHFREGRRGNKQQTGVVRESQNALRKVLSPSRSSLVPVLPAGRRETPRAP